MVRRLIFSPRPVSRRKLTSGTSFFRGVGWWRFEDHVTNLHNWLKKVDELMYVRAFQDSSLWKFVELGFLENECTDYRATKSTDKLETFPWDRQLYHISSSEEVEPWLKQSSKMPNAHPGEITLVPLGSLLLPNKYGTKSRLQREDPLTAPPPPEDSGQWQATNKFCWNSLSIWRPSTLTTFSPELSQKFSRKLHLTSPTRMSFTSRSP